MFKRAYLAERKIMQGMLLRTALSFLLTLALCSVVVIVTVFNRISVERLTMEQLIIEKSSKANEALSRLLYKTQTLSTLVQQYNGDIENFDALAATIVDDPSILNILLAPGGVVTDVFPLQGNEAVIGLNFFEEGEGNKEAIMAVESGQLVIGGPFNLVQGGQALVGRMPVYLTGNNGEKVFWGITSVTLKYPEALDRAGLNELKMQGFAYEIWRVNPDNNERQIIAGSGYNYNKNTRYIEKHIPIINADWYFRILPVRAWYEYVETWVLIFLSLCISLLVAFVMQSNCELNILKTKFENLAQIDALTGIPNRRRFLEIAAIQGERTVRLNSHSFLVVMDVDCFKDINDNYGHLVGDETLKEIVRRVKNDLRPYDLFARYGGDEFIFLISDIEKDEVLKLTERIRLSISREPVKTVDAQIYVSASFGVAPAFPKNDIDAAIRLADRALYNSKEEGRDRMAFCE